MIVNGKEEKFKINMSILDLLERYNLKADRVVVEVNAEIIDVDGYGDYIIDKADKIEIISFVGGG
ncbi:MAG: sulfur carrier protein ThiS [Clostridioides sp.]|nr:sulfur carrier protein ThiS [Clostridioides sp.]